MKFQILHWISYFHHRSITVTFYCVNKRIKIFFFFGKLLKISYSGQVFKPIDTLLDIVITISVLLFYKTESTWFRHSFSALQREDYMQDSRSQTSISGTTIVADDLRMKMCSIKVCLKILSIEIGFDLNMGSWELIEL